MCVAGNFTLSPFWKSAVYDRFLKKDILEIGDLIFAKINGVFRCQHFFDFHINIQNYDEVKKYINKGIKFQFYYIDQNLYENIKVWCDENNVNLKVIDSWSAPKLKFLNNITNYLNNECGIQTKKNYKNYQKNKNNFVFLDSKSNNVCELWDDVLKIDECSWKYRENSNMKSLDREDLQYQKFLFNNHEDSFLNVIYKDNIPLAYSLFFKNNLTKQWYAVKWGASDLGRKYYAGFFCLYNHLEKLEKMEGIVDIDFWGRRNSTYDSLKNCENDRYHILVSK